MERQSSAASSTEETSGPQGDLSSGSRRDDGQPDFTVFKDFDFLEYEDSIAGESTDNFNWGVRRHQLFEGEEDLFACNNSLSGVGAAGNGSNTSTVNANVGVAAMSGNGMISSNATSSTTALGRNGNGGRSISSAYNNNHNNDNNSGTGTLEINNSTNGSGIIASGGKSIVGGLFGSGIISFKCGNGGGHSLALEDNYSDKTPILSKRRRQATDDSSDEEGESESPIDEDHRQSFTKSGFNGQIQDPPTSLCLRRHRRRNSISRSDTSGSSAGDLGDITPCNASPHLPSGVIRFCSSSVVIRDEAEDNWRKQLQAILIHQPFAPTDELLLHLHRLVKEVTCKTISITKEAKKFFTGIGSHLGNRISLFTDLLNSRADPPRVWCSEMPLTIVTTPRFFETLRFNVLEVQEHLETFFDRKDQVMEVSTNKSSYQMKIFYC